MTTADLDKFAQELHEEIKHVKGLVTVGVTATGLAVYLKKGAKLSARIPDRFQGLPVKVVRVSNVVPGV